MGSIMGSQKIMGSDYGSNISDMVDLQCRHETRPFRTKIIFYIFLAIVKQTDRQTVS
jgi:hypothetical protein